jgi:hypothetical protein
MASMISPETLLDNIINPATREVALADLSRFRENVPDLAVLLWSTPGKIGIEFLKLIF